MTVFVRKLTQIRWVPAFESGPTPPELLSFLITEDGVSLWECEQSEADLVVANVVALYEGRPPSFLHVAQIEEGALAPLRLHMREAPELAAPIQRLRDAHRELLIATHEEAEGFVRVVRDAPKLRFSRTDVEAAVLRLFDSGELARERCGRAVRTVLDRERPQRG